MRCIYFYKTDCGRFFAEALAAEVETVFTNETCLVGTEAANKDE